MGYLISEIWNLENPCYLFATYGNGDKEESLARSAEAKLEQQAQEGT